MRSVAQSGAMGLVCSMLASGAPCAALVFIGIVRARLARSVAMDGSPDVLHYRRAASGSGGALCPWPWATRTLCDPWHSMDR